MRKILFGLFAFVLLSWMGGVVENSSAHPSGHSHKHILSHSNGHELSNDNVGAGQFSCPTSPCQHKHSQKEMVHPKQHKIGLDCGENLVKSVPVNSGTDDNPVLMKDMSPKDLLPAEARKFSSIAGCL